MKAAGISALAPVQGVRLSEQDRARAKAISERLAGAGGSAGTRP